MSSNTLLLIDGHAFAYRAYYAIRDLSTSDGRHTNAVYGFIKMLRQLEEYWRPTHWGVTFDAGLPEERVSIHEEYKANREEMPDTLHEQFELIDEFLAAANILSVQIPGQEADDCLATLALQAAADGVRILIASSDKDLFQLVSDQISIVTPTKANVRMGPEEVREKTGVLPELIVPWLAMVGDSSDNIPGVPGVGPKTAAKLLNEYGSLEGIAAHRDEIKSEKLRTALAENEEVVARNVLLVTLRHELKGLPAWQDFSCKRADESRLLRFFDDVEFKGMADAIRTPDLFA